MAVYRTVQLSFWTDSKVIDEFTPEDKYFYLYLMTNPHTNLCGCYELSTKAASDDTGYTKDTIERLIDRFERIHKVICYSKETKEVLIVNWSKYNWTESPKFRIALSAEIERVKNNSFKAFLTGLYNGNDTVSIPYRYGSDTSVTVTDTVYDTDTVSLKTNIQPTKEDISPAEDVLDLYRLHCPSLPDVRILNDKRRKHIKALLKAFTIEEITEGFKKAEASDFCKGKTGWKADFEFLINQNNMAKVLEGKYDNRDHKPESIADRWANI